MNSEKQIKASNIVWRRLNLFDSSLLGHDSINNKMNTHFFQRNGGHKKNIGTNTSIGIFL